MTPETNIIAIDASDFGGSAIAIANGQTFEAQSEAGAAETLASLLSDVVGKTGLDWQEFGLCACGIGPGSHTGIRVAIAVAKGVSIACGVKLAGITRFEQMAVQHPLPPDQPFDALTVAGRGQLAIQSFAAPTIATTKPVVFDPSDVADLLTSTTILLDQRCGPDIRQAILEIGTVGGMPLTVLDTTVHARYVAKAAILSTADATNRIFRPVYLQAVDARADAGAPLVRIAGDNL